MRSTDDDRVAIGKRCYENLSLSLSLFSLSFSRTRLDNERPLIKNKFLPRVKLLGNWSGQENSRRKWLH